MPPESRLNRTPVTFTFANVGPITNAKLELGDLTVIAGRNNTGKTYLVYTLYGFLKMWDSWPGLTKFLPRARKSPVADANRQHTIFGQILKQLKDQGNATVAFDREVLNAERTELMGSFTRSFSTGALAEVFSSPPDGFKGASISVDLNAALPESLQSVDINVSSDATLSIRYDGTNIVVTGPAPGWQQIDAGDLLFPVLRLYIRFLFPELSSDPFVLSAERFGISLFYKELDFTKNRLVDLLQKIGDSKDADRHFPFFLIDQNVSRYALPIKDNIDYTRSLSDLRKQRSEIHDDRLFDDIKTLMGGYYAASSDTIEFRSIARGERRFAIPLHLASSSARGLSDLYFFLRHVARRNQLLIIDEPEGHLDTANQILLARLLARVVRVGLKVLLTTHSDYLIKEINNLVMLSGPITGKATLLKELGYGDDDVISPEAIRAYVAEENGLSRCKVDRFGIDMPIFDTTIDRINTVANELASRVAEDAEG